MNKLFYTLAFLLLSGYVSAYPTGSCPPYTILYGKEIIFDLTEKPILSTIERDLAHSDLLGNMPSFNLFKSSTETQLYPNGDTLVSFQTNQPNQGTQNIFYEDGNLMTSIPYSDNVKSGEQKIYYANGILMATIPFNDDLIDGELLVYHSNGNVKMRQFFNQGTPAGTAEMYHPNGNLQVLQTYQDGVINGVQTQYYDDGQTTQSIIPYSNGLINGTVQLYYPNTVLLAEVNYANGKPLSNVCYTPAGQKSQLNALGLHNIENGVRPIVCPYIIESIPD